MTHLWSDGELITVTTDRHGCPVCFVWQGRQHDLSRIVQRWQVDLDWWTEQGRVWRDYMTVITTDRLLCVIFRDLASLEWRLVRVYD